MMNRTKIEWTDFTWNPITGCMHGCWYCYAKKYCVRFSKKYLANKNVAPNCDPNDPFSPRFWPERLKAPWHVGGWIGRKIFVCSISDLYAPWTPIEWRDKVHDSMFNCPTSHIFQILTKNPELIPPLKFPDNVWVGTTVTGENGDERNIVAIKEVNAKIRFVSFEPLLADVFKEPATQDEGMALSLEGIQWVIIGKLTGSRKVKLEIDWVNNIWFEAQRCGIPVFFKNNLGIKGAVQQFPDGGKT